jgi:hypothetical protein
MPPIIELLVSAAVTSEADLPSVKSTRSSARWPGAKVMASNATACSSSPFGSDPVKAPPIGKRQLINPRVRCVDEPQANQPIWHRRQRIHRAVHKDRVAAPALHGDHHAAWHDKATIFELAILDEQGQIVHAIF